MKKVYCKNCKYYRRETLTGNPYCGASKKYGKMLHSKDNFLEKSKSFREVWFADEINKNNDCPYYKRKWWKFWIK